MVFGEAFYGQLADPHIRQVMAIEVERGLSKSSNVLKFVGISIIIIACLEQGRSLTAISHEVMMPMMSQ